MGGLRRVELTRFRGHGVHRTGSTPARVRERSVRRYVRGSCAHHGRCGHGEVVGLDAARCALPRCAESETLQREKYLPAREARQLTDSNEGPASRADHGSWNAAIFVALLLVMAILFTAYVLLWDGGAHT